jgi:2-polyprenyl-3-methyl-5-hydroxy-6-metoxy-1,4-benzoquinol methylase
VKLGHNSKPPKNLILTRSERNNEANAMNLTEKLKAALWRQFGDPAYPSEWDGKVLGGGKLSQRFWEYHTAIELLGLAPDSVVLDIGGGSPETGAGFFTRVIAPHVREVHVMDVNIGDSSGAPKNIRFHRSLANFDTLSSLLKENQQISHVACISVFEHIPDEVRCGMVRAINNSFSGDIFVSTLEYHARKCFFEYQLTARTLSQLFEPLTQFYPSHMLGSPAWAEDAYRFACIGRGMFRRISPSAKAGLKEPGIPLWYPIALKFQRIMD